MGHVDDSDLLLSGHRRQNRSAARQLDVVCVRVKYEDIHLAIFHFYNPAMTASVGEGTASRMSMAMSAAPYCFQN